MKVLYLQGGAERAGAERMLYYLLSYLDRKRFTPVVAFLADGPFVEEVASLGVEVLRLGNPGRLRSRKARRLAVERVQEVIQDEKPDIVHANGEKMSVYGGRAAAAAGIPSIAWLHDSPGAGGLGGWLAQVALSKTPNDAIVTCARWLAADFGRKLGMEAVCIPNGIELDALPSHSPAVDQIRQELRWPEGPIVGHFTRLQKWKGTEVFIQAAAALKQRHPDARYLVVGAALFGREEGFLEHLRRMTTDAGLEESLLFTGYRADSIDVMAGCDVVAHCSLRPDPFPTVVIEGMALGKPVVATTTRGPEEALENHVTGFLVPPGDPSALAGALDRVLSSKELRLSIGAEASRVAHSKYSARRMAQDFQDLYQRLAGDGE